MVQKVMFLLLLAFSLNAQSQITVSPMEILANIKPGESKNFEVMIVNGSPKPLTNLTFSIKEYINLPNKNMMDTVKVQKNEKANHEHSILSFVKADVKNIDPIMPKTGKKITINVTIPKDFKGPLGFFAYSIEPTVASLIGKGQFSTGTKTQFFGRGLLNVVNDVSNNKKMELSKMTVSKKGVVDIEIKNVGDKVLEIQGDIIVLDSKNKQLGKFDLTNEHNTNLQLAVPLKNVSYKLSTAFPTQLLAKGNQLLINLRDFKRDYTQSFLKVVKAP